MDQFDYSQPYVTRDEYLEYKGIDLKVELQDNDNLSNKVERFIKDLTDFVLDYLVMEYGCNELNRELSVFEDLAEFRRKRIHFGMMEQIEYVLDNGLIHQNSGYNPETGAITDFSGIVIGSGALRQFRLGGFCNKQSRGSCRGSLDPRQYTLEELVLELAKKQDKVDGKGLSTNDFTDSAKMLLNALSKEINNKVDKVVGKMLSSNDFTDALKAKLLGIESNAQANVIEQVNVNNVPLTISGKTVNIELSSFGDSKEDKANKVSEVSSLSTDVQYPTAKCLYDNLQILREIAEGKTKSFSVDPSATGNNGFQSGNAIITVLSFTDVNGNLIDVTTLKKGDLVFTLNGENATYKDRWLINPATGSWGVIDADTPNLEGYVTTDTAQTISGIKTFSNGIKISTNEIPIEYSSGYNALLIGKSGYQIALRGNVIPSSSGTYNLGASNFKWKDIYFAGALKDGNNANYGYTLPDSTGLTANKELATTDQALNVINATDITNNTLTDEQIAILTNGKPTLISGTYGQYVNAIVYFPYPYVSGVHLYGRTLITGKGGENPITTQCRISATKLFSVENVSSSNGLQFNCVRTLNGKTIPAYPTLSSGDIYKQLIYKDDNTLAWGNRSGYEKISATDFENLTNQEKAEAIYKGLIIIGTITIYNNVKLKNAVFHPTLWNGYGTTTDSTSKQGFVEYQDANIANSGNFCLGSWRVEENLNYRINLNNQQLGSIELYSITKINGKGINNYLNNVYPYASNGTTTLQYETINNISISADTTFTLATAPSNTYPEYKANITNTDTSNAITITLPSSVTAIRSNDSNITTSDTNHTFTIPANSSVQVSIQNGHCYVFNWAVSSQGAGGSSVTLNGTAEASPSFYAPTTSGTTSSYDYQFLVSSGANNAPVWLNIVNYNSLSYLTTLDATAWGNLKANHYVDVASANIGTLATFDSKAQFVNVKLLINSVVQDVTLVRNKASSSNTYSGLFFIEESTHLYELSVYYVSGSTPKLVIRCATVY